MAKERLIDEQTQLILSIMDESHDKESFEARLNAIPKLKYQALENALKISNNNHQNIENLNSTLINKRIGNVKSRPLTRKSVKADGMSAGELVNKTAHLGEEPVDKNKNTWMKKKGAAADKENNDIFDGKGEVVCEYLGTNLANLVLNMESLTPKVRLHQGGNEISLMSKYIPGFKTIQDFQLDATRDRKKPANERKFNLKDQNFSGLGNVFAASFLVGDPDVNAGNIGLLNVNGKQILARIDFGKSMSYNAHLNRDDSSDENAPDYKYDSKLQSAQQYKEDILEFGTKANPLYDTKMFKKLDFAGEISETLLKLKESDIQTVLNKSIENLKEAYGNNFLNDSEINSCLKKRMGFKATDTLTEDAIKNKIRSNMLNLKGHLHEMSVGIMQETFPQREHAEKALRSYADARENNGINYAKFIQTLADEPSPVSFNNPKHFNKTNAKNTGGSEFNTALGNSVAITMPAILEAPAPVISSIIEVPTIKEPEKTRTIKHPLHRKALLRLNPITLKKLDDSQKTSPITSPKPKKLKSRKTNSPTL